MSITRREWLKLTSAAGTAWFVPRLSACSDGGVALPSYSYEGTPGPSTMFELGVASGDSTSSAVVFWTHVSPTTAGPVDVWLDVAKDAAFKHRVAAQSYTVDDTSDYTVKVDVTDLEPGRTYYYRFFALGVQSPVGRTRTLPTGRVDNVKLALVTCSNFGFGFFHAYGRVAERADIDAVVHLGDYIYEYQQGFYPFSAQSVRPVEPATVIVTLSDYRTRYRNYRSDPDLRECHRQHAWYVIWDDHEVTNDAYSTGASTHNSTTQGAYADRLAAAKQAYFEYMPIRGVPADGIHRTARFGDLVDMPLLDTRLEGRSPQILDLALDDASRTMLGSAQEAWLANELASSSAAWRVIAQQVMLAQFTDDATTHAPIYYDQWDGYPSARSRFFDAIEGSSGNVLVVTGDFHGACVAELTRDPWSSAYVPASGAGALAVEFVTTSITSPYLVFGTITTEETDALAACPHLKYLDLRDRGFAILDVTPDRAQADFYAVNDVGTATPGPATFLKGFVVASGTHHAVETTTPAPAGAGAPLAP